MHRYAFDATWPGDVPPPSRPLLMFDGGCPFCRATARLVARLDRPRRLAMLDRDDAAAAPYMARIPHEDVQASWQLIEPTGIRLMHGPAAIRLLEHIRATHRLGRALRGLRLTALATALNQVLGRIRKPLGPYFPDPRRPRRGPSQAAGARTEDLAAPRRAGCVADARLRTIRSGAGSAPSLSS